MTIAMLVGFVAGAVIALYFLSGDKEVIAVQEEIDDMERAAERYRQEANDWRMSK